MAAPAGARLPGLRTVRGAAWPLQCGAGLALGGGSGVVRLGIGGLTHGVGEGQEVVGSGRRGRVRAGQAEDFPTAWDGEPGRVFGTEVVAVRFGEGGERAKDRGGVGIDVRQGGDGRLAAG